MCRWQASDSFARVGSNQSNPTDDALVRHGVVSTFDPFFRDQKMKTLDSSRVR